MNKRIHLIKYALNMSVYTEYTHMHNYTWIFMDQITAGQLVWLDVEIHFSSLG